MQTRLLACLAGGLLGAAVAYPINGSLNMNPTVVLIVCSGIGLALGCVGSILVDVFAMNSADQD